MKIKVNKEEFLKALQVVQSIIETNVTTPILHNTMLAAGEDGLKISAANKTINLQYQISDADVASGGMTTVHARRLVGLVRELVGEKLEIDVDEKHVVSIRTGLSNYKIFGIPADEYPLMKVDEDGQSFTLEQSVFKEMLKKTAYAVSMDESREVLNGVFASVKDGKLEVVATDGRRLALVEQEVEIQSEIKFGIIIPTATVNELLKVLKDSGVMRIKLINDALAVFEVENIIMVSKLIKGTYPNYRQVIPEHCKEKISFNREDMLGILRRVAQLTKERNMPVRLNISKNNLRVFAVVPDVGEADENMPIKYKGEQIELAFNPDFLMDPLRSLACDEVCMEINDSLSPALVKCDMPFIYVIMPVHP